MADNGYGKRPMWQWILIYLVIGGIVYAGIYYFFLSKKGGYNYGSTRQNYQNPIMAQNTVTIQNMAFSPATITIKAGDSVIWTNQDTVTHTATANDKSFDTGELSNGQSKTIAFGKAGTYAYHCTIHPNMKGTVIVQ